MIKLVASFVFGAWCVQRIANLPSVLSLGLSAIFALIVLGYVKKTLPFTVDSHHRQPSILKQSLLLLAFLILGIVWASTRAAIRMHDELPPEWQQQVVIVQGVVASVPDASAARERFRFDVEKVLTEGAVIPTHISLNYYPHYFGFKQKQPKNNGQAVTLADQHFHAGARWVLAVKLKRPHGTLNPHGFDFSAWALSENMRATGSIKWKVKMERLDGLVLHPKYLLERLRENIKNNISRMLPNRPYAGVIQALVVGDDGGIDTDTWQVLLQTGVTHLMSISGLHITMLSGMAFGVFYALWRRLPKLVLMLPARKAATLAGVVAACMYAFVAGFSVPTQRTFYMLLVFAYALWIGRQINIAQVLSIGVLVVVLIDPWAVSAAGFWLSFGAVALISFALNGRVGRTHWLIGAIKTQWAVTIGMLPLLLIMFNQASIISPIANAIAIPVVSFIVTPLALFGSFLSFAWVLEVAYQFLDWLMQLLVWLNELPIALWRQHSPLSWTFWPALLGGLMLLLPKGVPLRTLGIAGFLPMLFVVPDRPVHGDMRVTVLDVGQGLSVHVQTATHDLIYDAGPKYSAQADAGSRIVLPYLYGEGVKQLDRLVVSHDDNDHSGGAGAILNSMPVAKVMSSYTFDALDGDAEYMQCITGDKWVWDGVTFNVLYPTVEHIYDDHVKDNNKSCVLNITSDGGSMLLTGDIQKKAEKYLLKHVDPVYLESDVMTVPHHGSKTSSSKEFLSAVMPTFSIASAGYLNRFGHPKPLVMGRYAKYDSVVYQSAEDGAVVIDFLYHEDVISLETWRSEYRRYWLDDVE